MLCLLFFLLLKKAKSYLSYRIPEKQKKRDNTQRYNNLSLLKEFKIFFINDFVNYC
jgi:hypothetical protein